jgi:PAS domain S-box-containing protein
MTAGGPALRPPGDYLEDVEALLASAHRVMTLHHFPEAVRAVFDVCRELVGASAGFAAVHNPETSPEEFLFVESDGKPCAVNPRPPEAVAQLLDAARRTGATVRENAVPGCPGMVCVPWGEIPVESLLLAPLVAAGVVEGFIGLINKPGGFTPRDERLAARFAEQAVLALQSSRTMAELAESRERFRAVVESAGDAIVTTNADGLVTGWNPAAETMFARTADAMLGQPVTLIIPAVFRDRHQQGMEDARSSVAPPDAGPREMTALRADGAEFPVEVSRRPWQTPRGTFFTAIVRDISARVGAARKLAESGELFRVVAETSRSLLVLMERDGRVRWNNPAAQRILGYAAEELAEPFALVHPEDRDRVVAAFTAAVAGEDAENVSYRYRTAWGEYVHLVSTTRRITVGGSELLWVSSQDVTELLSLRKRTAGPAAIPGIVGKDQAMLEIAGLVRQLSQVDVPVLVQGESGTGKELVAAAIHREGPRAARTFVPVNCAALPEHLLESELFGHVKGSFTGAYRDTKGRFGLADGGTIFLDEVAEIPLPVQVKLLRVLQEGIFERVGEDRSTRVDVRIISATNRDLRREVAAGRFREDLFYRLAVVEVTIPPLRDRAADIPLLVEHVLSEEASRVERRDGREISGKAIAVSPEALAILLAHGWPGNVRELQNVLRHAVVKSQGERILPAHLPALLVGGIAEGRTPRPRARRVTLTAEAVRDALLATRGHRGQAARRLGVSRATFYRFLDTLGGRIPD